MRGVDAGHHAAVKGVLPVQAQAVPLRPQESEMESYEKRKIKGDILKVQLKCHCQRVDSWTIFFENVGRRTAFKCQTEFKSGILTWAWHNLVL